MESRTLLTSSTVRCVLLVLALAGCDRPFRSPSAAPTNSHVQSGSSTRSGGLYVSGGNLVLKPGVPPTTFGVVRRPGEKPQLAYLIFFKTPRSDAAGRSLGTSGASKNDGETAEIRTTLTFDNSPIATQFTLILDRETKQVKGETLLIADKERDPAKGRVFLMDLTQTPPSIVQKDVKLPDEVAEPKDPETVETIVKTLVEELGRDAEVGKFLKSL